MNIELDTVRKLNKEIQRLYELKKQFSKCDGLKDECDKLEQEIANLESKERMAKVALARLFKENVPHPKAATAMTFRYVDGDKISVVAKKMEYAERYIYRLIDKGKAELKKAGDI